MCAGIGKTPTGLLHTTGRHLWRETFDEPEAAVQRGATTHNSNEDRSELIYRPTLLRFWETGAVYLRKPVQKEKKEQ